MAFRRRRAIILMGMNIDSRVYIEVSFWLRVFVFFLGGGGGGGGGWIRM